MICRSCRTTADGSNKSTSHIACAISEPSEVGTLRNIFITILEWTHSQCIDQRGLQLPVLLNRNYELTYRLLRASHGLQERVESYSNLSLSVTCLRNFLLVCNVHFCDRNNLELTTFGEEASGGFVVYCLTATSYQLCLNERHLRGYLIQ